MKKRNKLDRSANGATAFNLLLAIFVLLSSSTVLTASGADLDQTDTVQLGSPLSAESKNGNIVNNVNNNIEPPAVPSKALVADVEVKRSINNSMCVAADYYKFFSIAKFNQICQKERPQKIEFESMENYARNKQKDTSEASKEKTSPTNQALDHVNNNNHKESDVPSPTTAPQPIESRVQSTNTAYNNREPNTQRFNFASAECGAKVLRSNIEAKEVGAILSSSKDRYMLNPCSAKSKYVIIELCEEIGIDIIAIGTYEYFSSVIKNYQVLGSNRYPVTQWAVIGNFTAPNSRELHYYQLPELAWFKYIKIKMLTHYGNEFYCPISQVKVHGQTLVEQLKQELENDSSRDKKVGATSEGAKASNGGSAEASLSHDGEEDFLNWDGEALFESGDEIGDEDDEELFRADIAQLWLRKQTRPEYPQPPESKNNNNNVDPETDDTLEVLPGKPEGQTDPKQDVPLEPHVSTAILVADDDDEDDERNQNVDEGPGSELKKQNKTEEVPLKTNNIFSSLVDRIKQLESGLKLTSEYVKDLHVHYSTHFEHVLEKIIKHMTKMKTQVDRQKDRLDLLTKESRQEANNNVALLMARIDQLEVSFNHELKTYFLIALIGSVSFCIVFTTVFILSVNMCKKRSLNGASLSTRMKIKKERYKSR